MTELKTAAHLADVSRATTRLYSESGKTRQVTQEKKFAASKQLNFLPNYIEMTHHGRVKAEQLRS